MAELTDILNWRRWDDRVTTSGQPSGAQLAALKDAGITHIINLAPQHNRSALVGEQKIVEALGMTYIYIPVEFDDPTDADFEAFTQAFEQNKDHTIHVHCIYNARVSAFFYRYAKLGFGGDAETAFEMMDGIWRPGHDWANFIGDPAAKGQPNRYAGDDY